MWDAVGHSPKALLNRIDEHRLLAAADDPSFVREFHRVLSTFDTYMSEPIGQGEADARDGLVAYFCAEFGFHESLPIYSGGLGILAGDHCKAASDVGCPSSASACCIARVTSCRPSTREGSQRADVLRRRFRRPADHV